MPEEKRKRRTPKRKAAEVIDFSGHPEVHAWLVERAAANLRTVSSEVIYRLANSKKSIEAGKKNLIKE